MRKAHAPRARLAALYQALGAHGMNAGTAGNVSARTSHGMLITPTGITGDTVSPAHIVKTTLDGRHKGRLAPSSEWQMHAAIYQAAPEAQIIVHTHSDAATALACLNEPLPAFHYAVCTFGGADIPLAPYLTFGTPDLAEAAAAAIAGRSACLLANHGMILHAPDTETALRHAILLETLARQYLLARAAGTPRILTQPEIAAAIARYATYGQRPEDPK
jgi:L-fuculose-phosphate aldolase